MLIPVHAGIQVITSWTPAFAGVTVAKRQR